MPGTVLIISQNLLNLVLREVFGIVTSIISLLGKQGVQGFISKCQGLHLNPVLSDDRAQAKVMYPKENVNIIQIYVFLYAELNMLHCLNT